MDWQESQIDERERKVRVSDLPRAVIKTGQSTSMRAGGICWYIKGLSRRKKNALQETINEAYNCHHYRNILVVGGLDGKD